MCAVDVLFVIFLPVSFIISMASNQRVQPLFRDRRLHHWDAVFHSDVCILKSQGVREEKWSLLPCLLYRLHAFVIMGRAEKANNGGYSVPIQPWWTQFPHFRFRFDSLDCPFLRMVPSKVQQPGSFIVSLWLNSFFDAFDDVNRSLRSRQLRR